jgi:type IV pilus assembly protein PilM
VLSAPAFKENVLSFGASYGLALQGLKLATLSTNLVPPEIHVERAIQEKKPWALAGAAALMLGLTINYFGHWSAWRAARFTDDYKALEVSAGDLKRQTEDFEKQKNERLAKIAEIDDVTKHLTKNIEGRLRWAELLRAINASLPQTPGVDEKNREKFPEFLQPNISQRADLQITELNVVRVPSKAQWLSEAVVKEWNANLLPTDKREFRGGVEPAEGEANAAPADGDQGQAQPEEDEGPVDESLSGYVVEIRGHHFHNADTTNSGGAYVQNTLIKNLKEGSIDTFDLQGKPRKAKIRDDLFIEMPVLVYKSSTRDVKNPAYGREGLVQANVTQPEQIRQFNFVVQFWWQPEKKVEPAAAPEATNPEEAAGATASAGTVKEVQ